MTRPRQIETMYAFVATDPADNTEGVLSASIRGMHYPLVGADLERVESWRPVARRLAQELGLKVSLLHFTTRVVIEEDVLAAHTTTTQEESK